MRTNRHFESLDLSNREVKPTMPSIELPLVLELKFLPLLLKYVYHGNNNTLPIIISTFFNANQKQSLVDVLERYKKTIGWTMADIKEICPSICIHKILLEDCYNSSVEQQRRLNLIMKEVVNKEIIKWLNVGIIYPISDNFWVSLIQCIPMKGEETIVVNEKNELILIRTVTRWRVCIDYRKL